MLPDLDLVNVSRLQFGITAMYHFLFVPLTLGLSWILAMRLFPAVPYCVTNVAPAVLGARMAPFVVATVIGVVPYVAAYTFAGDKAGAVLDADVAPDVGKLAADLFPVMLALAALPVAAMLVRKLWKRPEAETAPR